MQRRRRQLFGVLPELSIEAGIVVRVDAAFGGSGGNRSIKEPRRDTQRANAKISILRQGRVGRRMAFAIESGFKAMMRSCKRSGEWFQCEDILAIVALYAVEHGDLVASGVVQMALAGDSQAAFVYARDLYQRYPDYFAHANPFTVAMLKPPQKTEPYEDEIRIIAG